MKFIRTIFLTGFFLLLIIGCEEYSTHEKYRRPDWLPGKLYTTVSVQENLTLFDECLRLTGLDTILDVSGSWTVFAPTDEAMQHYLSENQYASLSDIPLDELEVLTEFHIVQNPWTLEQLQNLGVNGWRTGDDENRNSYAFKRQTIFKNPVDKYWIERGRNREMIVIDSTASDDYKRVFVESRKYVPVFYDGYLDINGLTSEDYSYYFKRVFERGNVYYAGARILQADIFAENGFVHIIDRVVNPMLNAKELLERELPGETYKLFLELVYWYYPDFSPNMPATNNQPSVRLGGVVDTLWDLNFSDLAFDLQKERTGYEGPNTNETLVIHNGLFVPTDDAFREFIDGILTDKSGYPHWSDYKSLPQDVVGIIIPPHFKSVPIYPSKNQYREIFWEEGRFQQNEGDIIRREFGSNCTFIGLNSYIPDRVFTSVTGPVFCRPAYSHFRLAMQYSGIVDAIADNDGELCFFPIPDGALKTDTTMLLNWIDKDNNNYNFTEYNRDMQQMEVLGRGAISSRILNHVATTLPNGSANKEFLPTMGGNYIIWNNSESTVRGSLPSTIGFNGEVVMINNPVMLKGPHENGEAYSVKYWFNFENKSMQSILWRYPEFFSLLSKAGLYDHGSHDFTFIDHNENYTVFAPSDDALENYQADTLNMEDLSGFLKHHFIKGAIIFTDNKQPSGNYETAGGTILNIRTGPDIIEVLDENGDPYVSIQEQENTTNIMVSERSEVSSVVHEIDQVLIH
ncbi:MAG: fasciclin domain-containing protein [Bacteroidales bacterium]|nr:fasciclin domain-containing protein [Bacteroidales bacterium]